MSEWMPIETAPRDGRRVRLWIPYDSNSEETCSDIGSWVVESEKMLAAEYCPEWVRSEGGYWEFDGDDGPWDMQPTRWMPLREPS